MLFIFAAIQNKRFPGTNMSLSRMRPSISSPKLAIYPQEPSLFTRGIEDALIVHIAPVMMLLSPHQTVRMMQGPEGWQESRAGGRSSEEQGRRGEG